MSETFTCGDHGALVSYLYDECAPNERRAISTHVAICRECAEELTSLGATREQLATWTPPEAQLGFRIVSDSSSSNVLRPSRWWQKPMPAWAQAAAAALIFATGVTLGALRGVTSPSDRGPARSVPQQVNATTPAANTTSVTRAENRCPFPAMRFAAASTLQLSYGSSPRPRAYVNSFPVTVFMTASDRLNSA